MVMGKQFPRTITHFRPHQLTPHHLRIPSTCLRLLKPFRLNIRYASTFEAVAASATTQAATSSTKQAAAQIASQATASASLLTQRVKNILYGTTLTLALTFSYLYVTDVRAGIHQWAVVPSLSWAYDDAEEAHEVGNWALRGLWGVGLYPRERGRGKDGESGGGLGTEIFGHRLDSPIGTSAGIDKHAEIPDPLFALGAGIVEVGGCTPYPQDGNPKPRVWRLPSQNGLINRYGLNSEGADHVAMRLRQRVREFAYKIGSGIDQEAEQRVLDGEAGVPGGSLHKGKLLCVQVAKNSFTPEDDIEAVKKDYVYCVEQVGRFADILTVNVSSPNTPGLRDLQAVGPLTHILKGVVEAAGKVERREKPRVMVKVSPDEDSDKQIQGICEAICESGVDGVVVGNTTKRRNDLLPQGYNLPSREARMMLEEGGYSGPQLFERTVALTRRYRRILDEEFNQSSTEAASPSPPESPSSAASPSNTIQNEDLTSRLQATTERDAANLKPDTAEAESSSKSQPLIRIPARNNPFSSEESKPSAGTPALSADHHIKQIPPASAGGAEVGGKGALERKERKRERKIIFATGGVTNGKQALEVLEAGADVAQVYTALVYGGVGTIARIKDEMRNERKKRVGKGA